jgi:hypothetical protein
MCYSYPVCSNHGCFEQVRSRDVFLAPRNTRRQVSFVWVSQLDAPKKERWEEELFSFIPAAEVGTGLTFYVLQPLTFQIANRDTLKCAPKRYR